MPRSVRDILRTPQVGDHFIHWRDDRKIEVIKVVKVTRSVIVEVTGGGLIPVTRFFLNRHAFERAYGFLTLG